MPHCCMVKTTAYMVAQKNTRPHGHVIAVSAAVPMRTLTAGASTNRD